MLEKIFCKAWPLMLAVSLFFALPRPGEACSCITSTTTHPCVNLQHSDFVFAGRTIEVTESFRTIDEGDGSSYESLYRQFLFEISEVLVGEDKASVVVTTTGTGGGCGYPFEIGREYVVYTYLSDYGQLSTSICSHTRPIEEAEEDLAYARRLTPDWAPTLIFGSAQWLRGQRGSLEMTPITDGTIKLSGPKGINYTEQTDQDGQFLIELVEGGRFRLSTTWDSQIPRADDQVVKVQTGSCLGVELVVDRLPRLKGLLVGSDGMPATEDARLVLEPLKDDGAQSSSTTTCREDGSFDFVLETPGEYLLSVQPYRPGKFPAFFYPDTGNRVDAMILSLRAGDLVDVGLLSLPDPRQEARVSGVIRRPDGSLADGVPFLVYLDGNLERTERSDERGRFSFPAFVGAKYSFSPVHSNRPRERIKPIHLDLSTEPENLEIKVALFVEG